jgi:ElaB/YqjD/DUF883 family membrane-anchored ribosome-binding protein
MSEYGTHAPTFDGQSQSMVAQAQEKVHEKAQEASGNAARAVRQQVELRAGQAGTELRNVATAMRRSGHSLHADGSEGSAKVVDSVTDRIEGVASYLGNTSGDRMLHDVESFGRRQPWAMIGVGLGLGFVASRFLKASSHTRYEATQSPSPAVGAGSRSGASWPDASRPGSGVIPPAPAAPVYPSTPAVAPTQTIGGAAVTGR